MARARRRRLFLSEYSFIPQRRIENIKELRALYTDIDSYLLNLSIEWLLGNVELLIQDNEIPQSNIIIFSGRGIVFVWLLNPVPYKVLPLWQVLENNFAEKLSKIEADKKATDAARIFRIAGSTNTATNCTSCITFIDFISPVSAIWPNCWWS